MSKELGNFYYLNFYLSQLLQVNIDPLKNHLIELCQQILKIHLLQQRLIILILNQTQRKQRDSAKIQKIQLKSNYRPLISINNVKIYQVITSQQYNSTIQDQIEQYKRTAQELSYKLQQQINERFKANQICWELRTEITQKQILIEELHTKISKLTKHNQELKIEKQNLLINQPTKKLKESLDEANLAIKKLQDKLEKQETQSKQRQVSTEEQYQVNKSFNSQIQNEIRKGNSSHTPPQKTLKYNSLIHQIHILTKENLCLKQKLNQMQINEQNLENIMNHKQTDYVQRENFLKSRLKKIENKLRKRAKELYDKEMFTDFKRKIVKLHMHIKKQQKLIIELQTENKRLNELPPLKKELEQKGKDLRIKQAKIEKYREQLNDYEEINKNLKSQTLHLSTTNNVEEIEEWRNKYKKLEQEYTKLKKAKDTVIQDESKVNELKSELEILQSENENLKSEIKLLKLKQDMNNAPLEGNQYKQDIQKMSNRLNQNMEKIQDFQQQEKDQQLQSDIYETELETNLIEDDLKNLDIEMDELLNQRMNKLHEELFDLDQYLQ